MAKNISSNKESTTTNNNDKTNQKNTTNNQTSNHRSRSTTSSKKPKFKLNLNNHPISAAMSHSQQSMASNSTMIRMLTPDNKDIYQNNITADDNVINEDGDTNCSSLNTSKRNRTELSNLLIPENNSPHSESSSSQEMVHNVHQPTRTITTTKVVSSNPTLNFLLSTPIHYNGTTRPSIRSGSNASIVGDGKRPLAKRIILNPSGSSHEAESPQMNNQQQQQKIVLQKRVTKTNASTSAQLPTKSSTSKSISYLEEIRRMMHTFGDVRQPSIDSARIVESIVRHQMIMLLIEAEHVAQQRDKQSSSTHHKHISVEDFLFLLKHDWHKLAKLIRYLKFKDIKLKVLSSSMLPTLMDEKSVATTSNSTSKPSMKKISKCTLESLYRDVKNELQEENHEEECLTNGDGNQFMCTDDTTSRKSSSSFESSSSTMMNSHHQNTASSKRIKSCQDFILSVILTPQNRSDIERLLFHEPDFIDDYTFARNRRLNEFTEQMSVKEYLFYQSCRSVTFFGSSTGSQTISSSMFQKFQDWILNEPGYDLQHRLKLRPNPLGWEVVQYFAYETVAILVELALMVRNDQQRRISRPGGGANDRGLYPGTVECEVMSAKRFRREAMSANMKNVFLKTAKSDPMLNQQQYHGNVQQQTKSSSNNPMVVNVLQLQSSLKPTTNEQYATDVLRRASEKVMVFQLSSPSINKTNSSEQDGSKTNSKLHQWQNGVSSAITPEHILEAMRRFESGSNVFNRFGRCHGWMFGQNRRKRILCLQS